MSGSRGGYLSLIAGTIVLCGVSLWACRSLFPRSLVAVTVALAAGLSALGVGITLLMLQSESLQSRLATFIDPADVRFRLWDSAIRQFHLNPVWGTGSGTFVIYGRLFRVPYVQKDPTFAHNDYLQMLGEFGLVCAVVFAIFLLWHFVSGIRSIPQLTHAAMERGETRNIALALHLGALSAVGAYVMHSALDFNLHIPANAFLLAFAFGIIANPGVSAGRTFTFQRSVAAFSRVLLVVVALFALFHGLRLLPGEWFAERARAALRDGRPEEARAFAAKALEREVQNPDIYYYAGEAARQAVARQSGPAEELREESIRMFRRGLEVFPSDVRTLTKLAHAYIDFEMFEPAEETLQQALELDPKSTLIYAFYGLLYQRKGDFEEAESYYWTALELDLPGINTMAQAGFKAVHDALEPLRAAKTPIPPEVAEELEELKQSESAEP
jgi:Flp pilus assembly protein TadD